MNKKHYLALCQALIEERTSLPSFILTFLEWWRLAPLGDLEALYSEIEYYLESRSDETAILQTIQELLECQTIPEFL